MRASQVEHLNDKLKAHPVDSDLLVEREFVDEICEAHAKPGEAAYDSSHDMALTGDQERNQIKEIPCRQRQRQTGLKNTKNVQLSIPETASPLPRGPSRAVQRNDTALLLRGTREEMLGPVLPTGGQIKVN